MNAHRKASPLLAALVAVVLMLGSVLVSPATAAPRAEPRAAVAQYDPSDTFTATWKRADALKVRSDATNTSPLFGTNFPIMTNQVWVWDTWPLTDLSTNVVAHNGWHVIFSLVAPRTVGFNDRHSIARIGFFYSRDAKSWTYGGLLFPAGYSFGAREWAGSAILRAGNEVQARLPPRMVRRAGDDVRVTIAPENIHLFDPVSGRRL